MLNPVTLSPNAASEFKLKALDEIIITPLELLPTKLKEIFSVLNKEGLFPEYAGDSLQHLVLLLEEKQLSYLRSFEICQLSGELAKEELSKQSLLAASKAAIILHSALALSLAVAHKENSNEENSKIDYREIILQFKKLAEGIYDTLIKVNPESCEINAMRATLRGIKNISAIEKMIRQRLNLFSSHI